MSFYSTEKIVFWQYFAFVIIYDIMANMMHSLSWVEIEAARLYRNISLFKKLIGKERILCPAVKANAYGHGLEQSALIMVEAGADWLSVNSLFEAVLIRKAGIKVPIYIMGYVPIDELKIVVENEFHLVVYNKETLYVLAKITAELQKPAFTHLKLETGNYRQGITEDQLADFLNIYREYPLIQIIGVATHFANAEDNTDSSYVFFQLNNFKKMISLIEQAGFLPKYRHCANSAAIILFEETYFNMVRLGILAYGLWPSEGVKQFAAEQKKFLLELAPVLTWKTKVVQVKDVPAGAVIGYGCTYKATRLMRLAIIPVGYYDGYDRGLSSLAYVLIHGKKAPVRGRICMNITMVDVTEIPNVKLEDEVVLVGSQLDEQISAEQMAKWLSTINYEVTTRIREGLMRKVI